jgi:hypothetical protein
MKEILQKILSYAEYSKIPTVPFNRNIDNRIKKAGKKFKKLIPEHKTCAIGVLTKDSVYHGKTYKKGTLFVIDSNTRKYFWENGLLEKPEELAATYYYYDSMDAMWEGYNCFDSVTSTESTAEKLTGQAILLDLNFSSAKFKKGSFVTAINYAATGMYPEKYPKPSSGQNTNIEKLKLFSSELLILDRQNLTQKCSQSVLGAFLMALKCHTIKGTEDKVIEFIELFNKGWHGEASKSKCGVTHAVFEIHFKHTDLFSWGTKHKEMPLQLSFILHMIDNYVESKTTIRYVQKDYYTPYKEKHGYTALSSYMKKTA